jgi:hypothetical protein
MLFNPKIAPPQGRVTGRNIVHGKRSISERALLAADLHLNRIALVSPTVKQCAALTGCCVPYATAAIAIVDNPIAREAVLAGRNYRCG